MFVSPAFAQAGDNGGSGFEALLPLVLIFVVFYFLLIRPQQKKQKHDKGMLTAIRRGDRVVNLAAAAPDLPADLLGMLRGGREAFERAAAAAETAPDDARLAYAELRFHPLMTNAPKMICLGLNYAAHAAEGYARVSGRVGVSGIRPSGWRSRSGRRRPRHWPNGRPRHRRSWPRLVSAS